MQNFKQQAQRNEELFKEILGDDFDAICNLVETSNKLIKACAVPVIGDSRSFYLILKLYNSVSDLACCLDSLARGHVQTVFNSLRMIFETYCLVLHIQNDKSNVWENFRASKHCVQDSVKAVKHYPGCKRYGEIYGRLSAISHETSFSSVARQVDFEDIQLVYIKKLDSNRFEKQATCLSLIILMLRLLAVLAEEIVLDRLASPYFWEKTPQGFLQKLDTPEHKLDEDFTARANVFMLVAEAEARSRVSTSEGLDHNKIKEAFKSL